MANSIWLEFADGTYLAHLKNKRIDELERVTNANYADIHARLLTGVYRDTDGELTVFPLEAKWSNKEAVEIIRQGFIGGGKAKVNGEEKKVETFEVNALLNAYLDEAPRIEVWKLAAAISYATMEGHEPGEAKGA